MGSQRNFLLLVRGMKTGRPCVYLSGRKVVLFSPIWYQQMRLWNKVTRVRSLCGHVMVWCQRLLPYISITFVDFASSWIFYQNMKYHKNMKLLCSALVRFRKFKNKNIKWKFHANNLPLLWTSWVLVTCLNYFCFLILRWNFGHLYWNKNIETIE